MADGGLGFSTISQEAIIADAGDWLEYEIASRPWLARGYFMRGTITALIGSAGVSKSTLMLCWAVALALGEAFHGMQPLGPCRVLVFNAEDDQEEQKRRLTAILRAMGHTPADIEGKLIRATPTGVATLLTRDPDTKELVATAAMVELEALITRFHPDIVFIDPMVEIHTEEENSNTELRAVMAKLRALAADKRLSMTLVHHTGKAVTLAGDPNAARGASSIIGAVRTALTVMGMTAEEEASFGLQANARRNYFRLDGAKANYHSLTDCEWFERVVHQLSNGDLVAVPKPWGPPEDVITPEAQVAIEAGVKRGSPAGPYSTRLSDKEPRSIKALLEQLGIRTKDGQKNAVSALTAAGFTMAEFRDNKRNKVLGLRSRDGLPRADWLDAGIENETTQKPGTTYAQDGPA